MPLVNCPECKKQISDAATQCPHCGYPLRTAPASIGGMPTTIQLRLRGIEYKSKVSLLGLPLIHIATGFDDNGRKRIARGIIALGDVAFGVLAVGGAALGVVTIGGFSLGLAGALGGLAISAGVAVGGLGIGYAAIGGCAVGYYAMGGAAFGVHTVSAMGVDPAAADWFGEKLGGPFKSLKGFSNFSFPGMPSFPAKPGK